MTEEKISCDFDVTGEDKQIVIISHGFGSSKESPTATSVARKLRKAGIGSVRFDFPAHGESSVDGDFFRVENCLDYLEAIEKSVTEKYPEAEIAYFSSSFGAFINLLYLYKRPHKGKKSFLRCAAVDMPGIAKNWLDDESLRELEENGYIMLDEDYARPLKATRDFYEDLEAINLFELGFCDFPSSGTELRMIHGTADETAPYEDAMKFAKLYNIKLISIEGADHSFTTEGAMDRVREAALAFYTE